MGFLQSNAQEMEYIVNHSINETYMIESMSGSVREELSCGLQWIALAELILRLATRDPLSNCPTVASNCW